MLKTFSLRFRLLVSLAALLLPLPFTNACGVYYFGEDYRMAFLNPYLAGAEWSSFYYSADYLNRYVNEKNGLDRTRNGQEWAGRVGNDVSGEEVKAVLYFSSLDDVLNAVAEGPENERFKGNRFFKALLKPENKPVLDYLVFSKKYEYYSDNLMQDPWTNDDWGNEKSGDSELKPLKGWAKKQLASTTDPWLKRRYAYQLMLMHRYDGETAAFDKIYNEYFKDDRSSVLSDWALHHKAALTPDQGQQAYFYALSFDRCPEKNLASYQQFDKQYIEQALTFAKNDQERAAVLALFEVKNPGRSLANLRKIYAFDPANRELPLLLVREIAKLEDWLLTDALTGMGTASYPGDPWEEEARWEWTTEQWEEFRKVNKAKDLAYLAEVRAFVETMQPAKGGHLSSDLLHLLTGHLFLLEKNGAAAKKHLEAISKNAGPLIADQQATEQVLLLLNTADLNAAGVQDQLAAHLATVREHQDLFPKGPRDFQALHLLVSEAFMKKGNLTAAYLLHNYSLNVPISGRPDFGTAYYELIEFLDWQASEKDIDAVLALMDKKKKSAFETYLTEAYLPSRNALLDLRGTISFRNNNLEEALKSFSKVAPDFWQTKHEFSNQLISDPFVLWQDTLHRGVFPKTKTAVVQRMLDLEKGAKANPAKAAENYLLLATAWLNCSYKGKSWMMFAYGNSMWENEYPYNYCPKSKDMAQVYYRCSRAMEYLKKAETATKDKELLAKTAFLKSRIAWYNFDPAKEDAATWDALEWDQQGKYLYDREMSFYKSWAAQFKGTQNWRETTGICPVLLTYFGK